MCIGLSVLGFSNVFRTGELLGEEPRLWVFIVMSMLSGVGQCTNFCCALPELVDSIEN